MTGRNKQRVRRSRNIQIRVSDAEYFAFHRLAKRDKKTVSDFVRLKILGDRQRRAL